MKDGFNALADSLTKDELNYAASVLLAALEGKSAADHQFAEGEDAAKMTEAAEEASKVTNIAETYRAVEALRKRLEASGGDMGKKAEAPAKEDGNSPKTAREPGMAAEEKNAAVLTRMESAAEGYAAGEPHRRYENAVGRRELEMSRVSDYFSRDSRRYDTGFEKY
jgi:hypothetical protein